MRSIALLLAFVSLATLTSCATNSRNVANEDQDQETEKVASPFTYGHQPIGKRFVKEVY